jgi:hypothetical protein
MPPEETSLGRHSLERHQVQCAAMAIVRLIHWNEEEAKERAELLARFGYEALSKVPRGMSLLDELRRRPPAALVIDLDRLPSQGRDLALLIRKHGATRRIPLVFVGGKPENVARVREHLPDAVFTSWMQIGSSLRDAITHPPESPVTPASVFDAYSRTPLAKKLGIKAGLVIGTINAPEHFARSLEPLPEGVTLLRGHEGRCDLLICFLRSVAELRHRVREIARRRDITSIWLAWPKKSSGTATDLTQQNVREHGLAAGLVDYKICAIDATWSGLLFARRKPEKRAVPDNEVKQG